MSVTSYEVGAVFRLMDEASPVMRQISERLTSLEKLIGRVSSAMKGIGDVKVGALDGALQGIDDKLKLIGDKALGVGSKITRGMQIADDAIVDTGRRLQGIDSALGGIGKASEIGVNGIVANFGRADTAIGDTTRTAQTLSAELRSAATASREIGRLPGMSGGGGGGHIRPGSPSAGGGHGGGSHAAEVGMGLGMLGTMGLGEFLEGTKRLIEAGAQLEKFQAQLQAATGSMSDVARATAAAWNETGLNLNTSVSENLKHVSELRNITGSLPEAVQMLHPFTLADTALKSIKDDEIGGKAGKGNDLQTYNLARSLEQLGVTQDEDKLNSYTASLTRMMIGMKGLMDGTKLFQGINNAGGARYGWNQDFVTYGLGPLLQATNGRAGAQLYQLSRSYGQGVSTQQMAKGAEKYGLWNEDDEIWQGNAFKGMKVGSVFEADVLKHDPVKWAGDVREMMRKRGVNVDDTDVMTNVVAEVTRGNKNLGAIMDELILPKTYQALMKERGNISQVPEDAVGILQKHDPALAMEAFSKQWDNLITALGKPEVAKVADIMNGMASGMNSLAQWAAANPTAGKMMTEGAIAMAGALGILTGVGVIGALAFFLPSGAAAIGIAALISVAGTITAFHWDELGLSLDKAKKNIEDIGHVFDGINAALTKFFTGIADAIKALPGFLSHGEAGNAPMTFPEKAWRQQHPGLEPPPGLFQHTAFTDFANDNVSSIAQGVYQGLLLYAQGGGAAGGFGGGSGIIRASYEAGGGGSGSFTPSLAGPLPGAAATGEHADFIRATAARLGIDPRVAVAVAKSEGLGASWAGGDHGTSFGDFQMHFGGSGIRGMNAGGLGDIFNRETGLDARDPRNWKAVDEWALKWASKHGWGDWHGAARVGIGNHQGFGYRGPVPAVSGPPPTKTTPGVPASAGRIEATNLPPIHAHIYVGGKKVHHEIVKQFAQGGRYPTSMGGPDAHSHYVSPGTPVTDAA